MREGEGTISLRPEASSPRGWGVGEGGVRWGLVWSLSIGSPAAQGAVPASYSPQSSALSADSSSALAAVYRL